MTDKLPKVNYCCCGHVKGSHKENPPGRFEIVSHCRECQCLKYLKRDRPNIFDKAFAIFAVFGAGLLLITFVWLVGLFAFIPADDPFWGKELSYTMSEIVFPIMLLLGLIYFTMIVFLLSCTLDYFKYKKRKREPIEY